MNAVIVGADFMYRSDGSLVPVEINTNIALDRHNILERNSDIWDTKAFVEYVKAHDILNIVPDGELAVKFVRVLRDLKIVEYLEGESVDGKYSVRIQESNGQESLNLRSSWSSEAFLDTFCSDKSKFLALIEKESFGTNYSAKDLDGNVKGNGIKFEEPLKNYPNYIIKCNYPFYDLSTYPKLVRITEESELDKVVKNLPNNFHIEPFELNENRLYEEEDDNRIKLFRFIVAIFQEGERLVSIPICCYTKVVRKGPFTSFKNIPQEDVYETGDDGILTLKSEYRDYFLTKGIGENYSGLHILADENDEVLLSTGEWVKVSELKVGDLIKTIDDRHPELDEYSLTEFTSNSLTDVSIGKIYKLEGGFVTKIRLYFTDNSDWWDTEDSKYLRLNLQTQNVSWVPVKELSVGDVVLFSRITENGEMEYLQKEIQDLKVSRELTNAYGLSLKGPHIFFSREAGKVDGVVAIEHNAVGGGTGGTVWIREAIDCTAGRATLKNLQNQLAAAPAGSILYTGWFVNDTMYDACNTNDGWESSVTATAFEENQCCSNGRYLITVNYKL